MPVRAELLSEILGRHAPETLTICPPLHCDYGLNLEFGERVFVNQNCARWVLVLVVATVVCVVAAAATWYITISHEPAGVPVVSQRSMDNAMRRVADGLKTRNEHEFLSAADSDERGAQAAWAACAPAFTSKYDVTSNVGEGTNNAVVWLRIPGHPDQGCSVQLFWAKDAGWSMQANAGTN